MSEVGAPGAGAPAPASSPPPAQSVPLPDRAPSPPNPATGTPAAKDGEVSTGQPPSGKERKSIDDSIRDAASKVEAKQEVKEKAEPRDKPEPKKAAEPPAKKATEAPPARERGEHGHFAPKAGESAGEAPEPAQKAPHADPPSRFSPEAKAEWAALPEATRSETHRALRELEGGLHKYRQDAEAYHEIRDFDQLAKQSGTTLSKALANYVTIERDLASGDPQAVHSALQRVFQRAQVDPRQWAAAVLGQPPEAREAEQSQQFMSLKNEIASLKQQLHGVVSTQQQQQTATIAESVGSFASSHPRFDELSAPDLEDSIQNILQSNLIPRDLPPQQRLQMAYDKADRLNPDKATRMEAAVTRAVDRHSERLNPAGQKSIAGSPANGSDPTLPAKKGKHPSIDEALKRAASRHGAS